MMNDDSTPEDDAVEVFSHALRARVDSIVRQGFEGWIGTITCRDFQLDVDMTLRRANAVTDQDCADIISALRQVKCVTPECEADRARLIEKVKHL